jgi:hypothetical protein
MSKYKDVIGKFIIDDNVDLETVIRTINIDYKVDRIALAVEKEPDLFFIEKIDHELEKEKEEQKLEEPTFLRKSKLKIHDIGRP